MDNIEAKTDSAPELGLVPGSADYETRMAEWCAKHGVRNPDDGEPEETFIEPDSDMDETISEEIQDDGKHVDIYDCYGWRERFKIAELRAHVAKHGKLATWDDFARLGDLNSKDVADE
jgi:hypothetical protein